MLYETGYWMVKNQHENKVRVAEMQMLCWMCGKTRHDKTGNDNIRESVGVVPVVEKMVENRLRWFDYLERKSVDFVVCSKESRSNGEGEESEEDLEKL
ncbi:unnamed protein product [Vicia faba]|uniref:Uncharacterized protein n=1 Tax=Vicia faba TaxID=3906 RepID=A0AAV0ZHS1_VICFA|nr:unnamed protein product [Vicia faba]